MKGDLMNPKKKYKIKRRENTDPWTYQRWALYLDQANGVHEICSKIQRNVGVITPYCGVVCVEVVGRAP